MPTQHAQTTKALSLSCPKKFQTSPPDHIWGRGGGSSLRARVGSLIKTPYIQELYDQKEDYTNKS